MDASGGWRFHPLEQHLRGTAMRAAQFAQSFGAEEWVGLAGWLHDLGKFSPEFQSYLRNRSEFDPAAHLEGQGGKVDHSTAGGIWAVDHLGMAGRVLAYLITGHHAGLPDYQSETGGSLAARLARRERLEPALGALPAGALPDLAVPGHRPRVHTPSDLHLWIRMLFSCLVDADFLDTEAFMDAERSYLRQPGPGLAELQGRLDAHLKRLAERAAPSVVNQVRSEVLQACRSASPLAPGLFSLTVPTGGGKTLASMAFALGHALAHGKRRIIVAIPYTSIIEQTAEVLAGVFGPDSVLEHHSSLDPDRETPTGRLASENWDAPVIVTTNVQLFESLHSAKPSACRKLHNLADSVVILDEAQMLPPAYLKPILEVLSGLVRGFGASVVLCTATQPALEGHIGSGKVRFQGLEGVRELAPDPAGLADRLRRVELKLQSPGLEPIAWNDLARDLARHPQVLCIVNTRQDCRDLHGCMPPGTIHLSALMCAQHRSRVIADIRDRLRAGQDLRVISTQLVEAGVDLDFPVVYRALAGLDSMAQAAGRCNREGRLGGGQLGQVVLFVPPRPAPPGLLRKGEEAGLELLRRCPEAVHRLEPAAFRSYFQVFYDRVNDFDTQKITELLTAGAASGQFQFRRASEVFRLIDDSAQKSIVVRYGPCLDQIDGVLGQIRMRGPGRLLLRRLQRFTVTLPDRVCQALRDRGDLEEIAGLWVQASPGLYDDDLGLCADPARWRPELFIS